MSDMRERLLAAVIADPESDAPRLVFADWLDEQPSASDRDRATFIRLQCAGAKQKDDTHRKQLGAQAEVFWIKHYDEWVAPL